MLRRPATGRASLNGRAARSDDDEPEQHFSGLRSGFRGKRPTRLRSPQIISNERVRFSGGRAESGMLRPPNAGVEKRAFHIAGRDPRRSATCAAVTLQARFT
jgi:hypothetical protein